MSSANNPTLTEGNAFPSALARFLFQILLIVTLSRIIAWVLAKWKQPSVIAEMIAGILLGPSLMSSYFGDFKAQVFPADSIRIVQVVSQFGLVVFMFLVGLELDSREFKAHFKQVFAISGLGVIIPCFIAAPFSLVFDSPEFSNTTTFNLMLFNGVAIGMSALPVLARILSERNMLGSKLGNMIMGATSLDDVMAWFLLSIVVAVVRSAKQIEILYTFLLAIAYFLIAFFILRPALNRMCRKVETKNDVTPQIFFGIFAIMLISGYVTEAIGLSALIGGFTIGLFVPRKPALVSALNQKLEDFIVIVVMPLFFTNSGLRTDFRLLNDWRSWGLCLFYVVVATVSKVIAIFIPAKCFGLSTRDSLAFGILMSCKGLVALIVVNFGLDYNVITQKLFSILVIMVLITSVITVPLTELVLPLSMFKNLPRRIEVEGADGDMELSVSISPREEKKPRTPQRPERTHPQNSSQAELIISSAGDARLSSVYHGAESLAAVDTMSLPRLHSGGALSPRSSSSNELTVRFTQFLPDTDNAIGEHGLRSTGVPIQVAMRIMVCLTHYRRSPGLVSLASRLLKRGGKTVPTSTLVGYRPMLDSVSYFSSYLHTSSETRAQEDDALQVAAERAKVHHIDLPYMVFAGNTHEFSAHMLGAAQAIIPDFLLFSSSAFADLMPEEKSNAGPMVCATNIMRRCNSLMGVLIEQQSGWPLTDVTSAVLPLIPGPHGAAAVRIASVLAAHNVQIRPLLLPCFPEHGHTLPASFAQPASDQQIAEAHQNENQRDPTIQLDIDAPNPNNPSNPELSQPELSQNPAHPNAIDAGSAAQMVRVIETELKSHLDLQSQVVLMGDLQGPAAACETIMKLQRICSVLVVRAPLAVPNGGDGNDGDADNETRSIFLKSLIETVDVPM